MPRSQGTLKQQAINSDSGSLEVEISFLTVVCRTDSGRTERVGARHVHLLNSYLTWQFEQRWINPALVPDPADFGQALIQDGFQALGKRFFEPQRIKEYKAGVRAWKAQVLPKQTSRVALARRQALERSIMSLGILQGGGGQPEKVWINLAPGAFRHDLPFGIKASFERALKVPHARSKPISLIVVSGEDTPHLTYVLKSLLDSGLSSLIGRCDATTPEEEALLHALQVAFDYILQRSLKAQEPRIPSLFDNHTASSAHLEQPVQFDSIQTARLVSHEPVTDESVSEILAYEPIAGGYLAIQAMSRVANTAEDFSKAYGRYRRKLDPEPSCSIQEFPVLVPNAEPDDNGRPPTVYQNLSYLEGSANIKQRAKVRVPDDGRPFTPAQMRRLINSILAPKSVGTYYALIGLLSEPAALAAVSPDAQHIFRHNGLTIAANVDLRKLLPVIGFTDKRHVNEKNIHDFLDLLASWNQVYIHVKNPTLWNKKKKQYVSYDCEAPLLPFFTYDDSLRKPGQKGVKAGPAYAYIDMGPLARFSSTFRIPVPKGVELGWAPRPLLYWLWAKAFEKTDFGRRPIESPVTFTLSQGATFIGLHSRVENLSKYRKQVEETLTKVLHELKAAGLLPDFELEDEQFKVYFTDAFMGNVFQSQDSSSSAPRLLTDRSNP